MQRVVEVVRCEANSIISKLREIRQHLVDLLANLLERISCDYQLCDVGGARDLVVHQLRDLLLQGLLVRLLHLVDLATIRLVTDLAIKSAITSSVIAELIARSITNRIVAEGLVLRKQQRV